MDFTLTTPERPTLEEIEAYAEDLEGKSVREILEWALTRFDDRLGMMTAMGYSGIILLDHLRQIRPNPDVFFIDTGFHFPETLNLLKYVRDEWGVRFNVIHPEMSLEELRRRLGPEPWLANPDLCCHHMKVEPMLRVLGTRVAWLSAIRRDQSLTRARIEHIEIDGRGTIKVYPLAAWTFEDCWAYIFERNLPYNELHNRGYPSVGCIYCTQPVMDGEHERSGRWNSMPKLECGLHLHKRDEGKG